jgi:hypothetical protein
MDFSNPKIHKSGSSLHVTYGDMSQLFPEFEMIEVEDAEKSAETGRAETKMVHAVRIFFPGDRTKVVVKLVSDLDPQLKEYWREPIAAFLKSESVAVDGYPLENAMWLQKPDVRMMKSYGIATLEQLAAIGDSNLPTGWRPFRDKAKAVLKAHEDERATIKMSEEMEEMRAMIASLKAQIVDMEKRKKAA